MVALAAGEVVISSASGTEDLDSNPSKVNSFL
jgi:hypothetical protein